MSVSILIPLYNGIEFLKECIESIKQQTYPYWEIIIGINGHPKNSDIYKQAKKYEHTQIKVIEYLDTRGKPQTLNKMINDCSYDIICLLDVDDKWLPKKLEEQIKVKKDYDVVGTLCQYFGSKQDIPRVPKQKIRKRKFLKMNPIINSSCMINKKDAIWNNEFLEDYDMWLRLNYEGKTFYNIPKILTLHRIHDKSHFNNTNNNCVPQLIAKWTKIYNNK